MFKDGEKEPSKDGSEQQNFDDCTLGYSNTPALRTDRNKNTDLPMKDLRVLIDWVGFTLSNEHWNIIKVKAFFHALLGIDYECWMPFQKHYQGYAESIKYENIIIYYMGEEDQGIHIDITGKGCRFVESCFIRRGLLENNWHTFLTSILGGGGSFTRFDIAIDDFTGNFSVRQLYDKLIKGECTSKFKSWRPDGNFDFNGGNKGLTLYFGSPTSRLVCCIYEKNKESEVDMFSWNRIELRFKKERADELIAMFVNQTYEDFKTLGVIVAGVLKNYIQFRDKSISDSNKRRWNISKFWSDFLAHAERLELTSAVGQPNIIKSKSWVDKSVSKTLAMLFFAFQDIDDNWLRKIVQDGSLKLGAAEKEAINEFRRIYGEKIQIPKHADKKNSRKNSDQKTELTKIN